MRNRVLLAAAPFVALLFFVFLTMPAHFAELGGEAHATPQSPPTQPSTATVETLGALLRTDGWCVAATTTEANAWSTAPARITAIQNSIRFITVRYSDRVDTTDVCAKLGGDAGVLTCDLGTATTGVLSSKGEALSWVLARDAVSSTRSTPLQAPPAIWLRTASDTISTCIDVGW